MKTLDLSKLNVIFILLLLTTSNSGEDGQQAGAEQHNNEDLKPSPIESESKQDNTKEDESNHKILVEVNSVTEDKSHLKDDKKRETTREKCSSDFMAMPRDYTYFFDDLEPFVSPECDSRIGRAVPAREFKIQKSRLTNKGKENIEDDIDEEDEDEKAEEDEKLNEDEYDDEYDMDSDCKPTTTNHNCLTTTGCKTTTPGCTTTTTPCSTTTPCPPSTTKCTTKAQCSTTCKPQTVKCPHVCTKDKKCLSNLDKHDSDMPALDIDRKKLRHNKRRFHNKEKIISN